MSEKQIQHVLVRSSNVHSVGYSLQARALEVPFRSGGVYRYYDVPKFVYDALLHAPSTGKFLAANVKGIYRYRKVADRPMDAPAPLV